MTTIAKKILNDTPYYSAQSYKTLVEMEARSQGTLVYEGHELIERDGCEPYQCMRMTKDYLLSDGSKIRVSGVTGTVFDI